MSTRFYSAGTSIDSLFPPGFSLSLPTAAFDGIALIATIIVILLSWIWSYVVPKKGEIPFEFWYQVPQSQGTQAEARQKKADSRNIAVVFAEQVRIPFILNDFFA
jgi:hypothetical protein